MRAGADLPDALSGSQPTLQGSTASLYDETARLFAARTPIVAAMVAGPRTRFVATAPLTVVSIRQSLRGSKRGLHRRSVGLSDGTGS